MTSLNQNQGSFIFNERRVLAEMWAAQPAASKVLAMFITKLAF